MELAQFIQDITQRGKVIVVGQVIPFTNEDAQLASKLLHAYYNHQAQELSGIIPAFHAHAAVWAASYLYRAVQLTMLRDLDEEAVARLLTPFDGPVSPETVLSVDLSFRYLPNLLGLAKGLAPDDKLVIQLQQAAIQWPFSSVGMKLQADWEAAIIMNDACLRRTYIDRIITARDRKRCNNHLVNEYIREALGDHGQTLWPDWEPEIKEK